LRLPLFPVTDTVYFQIKKVVYLIFKVDDYYLSIIRKIYQEANSKIKFKLLKIDH